MRRIGIAAAAAALAVFAGCDQTPEEGTPFLVISAYPADQQTNVPVASLVTIRTTHPIDHTTVIGTKQIILVNQQNAVVPVSYAFNGELLSVTPGTPLAPNATYGLAVRPGVRDIYGNNVETPYALTFSTGPQLGSIPNWPPFTLTSTVPPTTLGPPGTFTPVSPLWVPRARHTSNRLNDGRIIVIGGENGPGFSTCNYSAELFDPTTLQWMPSAGNNYFGMFYQRAGHTSTLLPNGKILVVGGTSNGLQAHNSAELYDPASDSFIVVPGRLAIGRMFHAASALPNGNVIVSGGATTSIASTGIMTTPLTDTIEVYDSNSGTFQMSQVNMTQGFLASNPGAAAWIVYGLIYHTSTPLPDATVLFTGGVTFLSSPAVTRACAIYQPDLTGVGTNGSIRAPGRLMMGFRAEHRATMIPEGEAAGLLLITGGLDLNTVHQSGEIFDYNMLDASTNRKGVFRYLASNQSVGRRSHTATYIPSSAYASRTHPWGKVLVAGGSQRVGTVPQPQPYPPHYWPFIEVVGCGGCSATNFADIFDAFSLGYKNPSLPFLGIDQTGQFLRTRDPQGNLTVIPQCPYLGRYWHTADGLSDGSVLIAGGYDCVPCMGGPAEGQILTTSCIYNP
jgi:hypothetical protein